VFAAEHRAVDIDRENTMEIVHLDPLDILAATAMGDARIVDQTVQPANILGDGRDHFLPMGLGGNVEPVEHALDLLGQCAALGLQQVCDQHHRTLGGEAAHDGRPQTAGPACYQHALG